MDILISLELPDVLWEDCLQGGAWMGPAGLGCSALRGSSALAARQLLAGHSWMQSSAAAGAGDGPGQRWRPALGDLPGPCLLRDQDVH